MAILTPAEIAHLAIKGTEAWLDLVGEKNNLDAGQFIKEFSEHITPVQSASASPALINKDTGRQNC